MKYSNIKRAKFVQRPNRFIAICNIDGVDETVHVKNTGRCKELLTNGATVFLEESDNPNRKTKFDLVAVKKVNRLINMDSQSPNKAVFEWLKKGTLVKEPTLIKPEKVFGKSRLDFYVENNDEKVFIEVKGVTLENDGVVSFPDAPTERGRKHIYELIKAKEQGYRAIILFVIQMNGVKYFTPNKENDLPFSNALVDAEKAGVEIVAVDCIVEENGIKIDKSVPIKL